MKETCWGPAMTLPSTIQSEQQDDLNRVRKKHGFSWMKSLAERAVHRINAIMGCCKEILETRCSRKET
jgi:hypothetical protein